MEKKNSGGTSKLNAFKARANVSEGVPIRPWKPLASGWLVEGHRRQDEIDRMKAIPSRWKK